MRHQAFTWEVTSPDGKSIIVCDLSKFCRNNNLDQSTMVAVSRGRVPHHKHWTCRKLHEHQPWMTEFTMYIESLSDATIHEYMHMVDVILLHKRQFNEDLKQECYITMFIQMSRYESRLPIYRHVPVFSWIWKGVEFTIKTFYHKQKKKIEYYSISLESLEENKDNFEEY